VLSSFYRTLNLSDCSADRRQVENGFQPAHLFPLIFTGRGWKSPKFGLDLRPIPVWVALFWKHSNIWNLKQFLLSSDLLAYFLLQFDHSLLIKMQERGLQKVGWTNRYNSVLHCRLCLNLVGLVGDIVITTVTGSRNKPLNVVSRAYFSHEYSYVHHIRYRVENSVPWAI